MIYPLTMKRVVLISCVSRKLAHAALAKDLYVSALFQFWLRYARTLEPDNIFILSAKYGLVDLEQPLEPYNDTLNTKRDTEIRHSAQDRALLHCICLLLTQSGHSQPYCGVAI
jgi:hypothetical protein